MLGKGQRCIRTGFFLAHAPDAVWLRFPGDCDFRIEFQHRRIHCFPVEGLSQESLAHTILNQVMPRVAAQAGKIVLHASAVHLSGATVAFTGPSGIGKSSLAARLCEAGASLMADDGLVIENEAEVLAIPAYPGLRLRHGTPLPPCPEGSEGTGAPSFRNKFIFNGEHLPFRFHDEPTPLKALILLADGAKGKVEIERLSARGAFETIASNCFRLDAGDRGRMVREFTQITSLVDRLPVYRLSYPRIWAVIPSVIDRIKRVLHSPAPASMNKDSGDH